MALSPSPDRSNQCVAWICGGVALFMVGAAYAAVPLYDLFCRTTGFDGTPRSGAQAQSTVPIIDRTISVRFDANVAPGLSWKFSAETPEIELKLGEVKTAYYNVRNTGTEPAAGMATYNVQPDLAGSYFVKLQCFCFTEQVLQPGEERDEAVVFYVDPALVNDRDIAALPTITLSYTFFAARNGAPEVAPVKSADTRK